MAFVCFVYVCDVHHIDKRGLCMLLTCIRGEAWPRVPPSPSQGRATVRLPPSKFFIFFLPYPITSSIYPFFLSLRGFLFLCVYFPIRVSFVSLRAKTGKIRIVFLILPVSMWLLCALFSFYILILCYFPLLFFSLYYVLALSFVVDAVFFADLPIFLPSVGLPSLLCVIIRLGVFRGSEAKKIRFCVVVG